ncbi:MAG: CoA transferase, partial [Pseudomonadales bacterium]
MTLLKDITVLDLTRVVAGPACTRTLADLGAEVLKIEPPNGDLMRRGVPKRGGVALGYAQQNAGKRHLCVDLTQETGQTLVRRLADQCDIVVENYRPGVAARLGLGYELLRQSNPALIYCSISGYGQEGRASRRRAYAPIIHAELGLIELNARERGTPPLPEAISHADFAVSAQATAGILAALVQRLQTGRGQHVDVSMAETMLAMNEWTAVEVNGGIGDEISPFRPGKAALLRTADGAWVQLPGNPLTGVFAIARALGREQALAEHGWHGFEDTRDKTAEVHALLQSWAAEFATVTEFEAALDK